MKFNDAVFGALLLALSPVIFGQTATFSNIPGQNIGPAAFPRVLALLLGGCAVALTWRGCRGRHLQAWVEVGRWLRSSAMRCGPKRSGSSSAACC